MSKVTWYQLSALSEVYDVFKLHLVEAEVNYKNKQEELQKFKTQHPRVDGSSRMNLLLQLDSADRETRKRIRMKVEKMDAINAKYKKLCELEDVVKDLEDKTQKRKKELVENMKALKNFGKPKIVYRISDFGLIQKYKDWIHVTIDVRDFGQKSKDDLQRFVDVSSLYNIPIPEVIKRGEGTDCVGIYLSTPKTKKFSEYGENEKLRYGLSSMQGWRSTMEDAHAACLDLDSSTSIFGVYDGHGGKAVSKFCAKYLHQQMLKNEAYAAGDIGTAAQKAFLRMDEMMCGQKGRKELQLLARDKIEKITGMAEGLIRSPKSGEANGQVDDWPVDNAPQSDYRGPNAGSTACVAVVRNSQLVVANAGDSRCVISRNGQAHDLSEDHKPDLEVEKERILSAGGYIQCGRVNGKVHVARAIGDMELKKDKLLPPEKQILTANPDIKTVNMRDDDDFLVVACDGIWECMTSQQVVDVVNRYIVQGIKLSVICEKILDKCVSPKADGKGCNNMTIVIVKFKKRSAQSYSTKKYPDRPAHRRLKSPV